MNAHTFHLNTKFITKNIRYFNIISLHFHTHTLRTTGRHVEIIFIMADTSVWLYAKIYLILFV